MATLDDAAEALVVKLRGLDSEIEESEHQLQEYRSRIEATSHEVDLEWTALGEAVSSFLTKVHEHKDRLDQETQQALHATTDAQQALAATATEAHSEIAEARAHLDGLAQHATGLQPSVESLANETGVAPAHALAQRAAQIEQELSHALDEARDFLRNEVVHGLEQLAQDTRERCQAVRTALAEESTQALQTVFDDWESKVDELEEYVKTEGFLSSQRHVHDVVDYALTECQTPFAQQFDSLHAIAEVLVGQVQELGAEVQRAADAVVAHTGTELTAGLDNTREAVATAVSVLGSVREFLASYRFVNV